MTISTVGWWVHSTHAQRAAWSGEATGADLRGVGQVAIAAGAPVLLIDRSLRVTLSRARFGVSTLLAEQFGDSSWAGLALIMQALVTHDRTLLADLMEAASRRLVRSLRSSDAFHASVARLAAAPPGAGAVLTPWDASLAAQCAVPFESESLSACESHAVRDPARLADRLLESLEATAQVTSHLLRHRTIPAEQVRRVRHEIIFGALAELLGHTTGARQSTLLDDPAMLTERDRYMAHRLLADPTLRSGEADVIAVVGAAHVPGMAAELERALSSRLDGLSESEVATLGAVAPGHLMRVVGEPLMGLAVTAWAWTRVRAASPVAARAVAGVAAVAVIGSGVATWRAISLLRQVGSDARRAAEAAFEHPSRVNE